MGAIKNKMRSNIRGRWSIFNVSTGVYKYYTFTIMCGVMRNGSRPPHYTGRGSCCCCLLMGIRVYFDGDKGEPLQ